MTPLTTPQSSFEPLLTPQEAGTLLGIHSKTIVKMARDRQLPGHRIGKHWRFRASSLDGWLSSQITSKGQPA
jgi:excisionase family DNA binding protein